jgi:hypothetical protein
MATFIGGGDAVMREGLEIPPHDYYINTWTDGKITQTVYKRGGASGTVVATVTMTYDGSGNLLTVTRA